MNQEEEDKWEEDREEPEEEDWEDKDEAEDTAAPAILGRRHE